MRYHKDIGFPDTIRWPIITAKLGYTRHAIGRKKRENQFDIKRLPTTVKVSKKNIVEIHTDDDIKITKAVVTTHYTETKNLVLVLDLNLPKSNASVITLWINKKTDSGKLKNFLYNKPNNLKPINHALQQ